MTESPTPVGEEAEKLQKTSLLVMYSRQDMADTALEVIKELREAGLNVIDINDKIADGSWVGESDKILENTPAVLVIPSKSIKEDGLVKDAVYRADMLRVEKRKRIVPIFFQANANVSIGGLGSLAGINWDGETEGIQNFDKTAAFGHLKTFVAQNTNS